MGTGDVVSLIVVSFNARDLLLETLRSARRSAGDLPLEMLVVDNGSADGSPEAVAREVPEAQIILCGDNKGFAWANNRGAALAKGGLLLFANNDVVFLDGAIEEMAEFMIREPGVAAVGPKVLNPDGSLQFSGKRVPGVATGVLVASGLHRWFPWRRPWEEYYLLPEEYSSLQEVDHLTACCLMTRRKVWEQVGGFDDGYFMYFEDIDWCLRARRRGMRLVYLPTASVIHYKSASARRRPLGAIRDYHRSARRFYDRHYAPATPLMVNWLIRLGISARMVLHLMMAFLGLQKGVKY